MHRLWTTVAIGALIAGLTSLSGAALAQSEAVCAPADEQVSLRIWFGRDQFIPDDRFESFHAQHPNITVQIDTLPLEQHPADFLRTFEAGQAPDIIQPEYAEIGVLARRGMLLNIQPLLDNWQQDNPELFDAMTETAWDMASFEGTRHGLALHHGVFWNVFRKDVMDELGLDQPQSWEDVLDVGQAISEGGPEGMYGYALNASNAQAPVWDRARFAQMGGQFVDGVMQIDSEEGHYWLNWMQRAASRGVISPDTLAMEWPDVIANFRSGQAAMAMISRNVFPADIAPHIEYGTAWEISASPYTMPGKEDASRYVTNGWPYMVSAQTKHPCEVGLVLQYLADDAQALSVAKRYQPVSNTRVMSSDEYLGVAPWGAVMNEVWDDLEVLPYHANQVAMNRVLRDVMQEAIRNPEGDVAEMAERYQAQLDRLAAAGR